MTDLSTRLQNIEERNTRVTDDKAWEISWTRRGLIALITYGCGIVLLTALGHDEAWKHAIVPVMGYLLSTLSLPAIKKIWIAERQRGEGNGTIH